MKEEHQLEIHMKNKELSSVAMNVVNKNDVLDRVHKLIKEIPDIAEQEGVKKIVQELRISESVENDWGKFK